MKTASDFLDAVKAANGLRSDYQLAKFLGWNQQRITKIRHGASFDDDASAQIADALDLDAGYVAACMSAQRAQSAEARKMWEKAARTLAGTAAAILAGCTLAIAPLPHFVQDAAAQGVATVYYVKSLMLLLALAWAARQVRRHPAHFPLVIDC